MDLAQQEEIDYSETNNDRENLIAGSQKNCHYKQKLKESLGKSLTYGLNIIRVINKTYTRWRR